MDGAKYEEWRAGDSKSLGELYTSYFLEGVIYRHLTISLTSHFNKVGGVEWESIYH